MTARTKRDCAIIAAREAGISASKIADLTGLTKRRVDQIVADARPQSFRGRPRLPIRNEDRPLYAKMRRYYGAEFAQQQLGIEL